MISNLMRLGSQIWRYLLSVICLESSWQRITEGSRNTLIFVIWLNAWLLSLWVGGFCTDDVKTTRGDYKQEWLWLVTISTNTVNNFECRFYIYLSVFHKLNWLVNICVKVTVSNPVANSHLCMLLGRINSWPYKKS